jgi:hypothetical protein
VTAINGSPDVGRVTGIDARRRHRAARSARRSRCSRKRRKPCSRRAASGTRDLGRKQWRPRPAPLAAWPCSPCASWR